MAGNKKVIVNKNLIPDNFAESVAEEVMGITFQNDEQLAENSNVGNVDNVDDVEQQGQQIQHTQQDQQEGSSDDEQHPEKEEVDGSEQQNSVVGEKPSAKTPKRTFPGKQHMHLILPNELAEAVKLLAKVQNKSVNEFMKDLIETHMEDWKPLIEQLGCIEKNIGVKSSKKRLL
ncbi:hypothetical protein [Anaerovibrio lipolyticus]|uniref:hypothetical protein n=1 Tax=Anaerovibrio lipolyticus TaxID=82374 RepID=UPI00048738B8|nr:hypothetical protein [Anaerovibrio lipolyticus]